MSRQQEPLSEESSRLCRSCGLCCQGILHRKGVLEAAEASKVRALGLQIVEEAGEPFFALPCRAYSGDLCQIYPDRPNACAGYRCQLLRQLTAGEKTLEESLQIVQTARQMVHELRQQLAVRPEDSLWDRLPAPGCDSPEVPAALLLDAATLRIFCRRHFEIASLPLQIVPE